jgi:hypothetical protein
MILPRRLRPDLAKGLGQRSHRVVRGVWAALAEDGLGVEPGTDPRPVREGTDRYPNEQAAAFDLAFNEPLRPDGERLERHEMDVQRMRKMRGLRDRLERR